MNFDEGEMNENEKIIIMGSPSTRDLETTIDDLISSSGDFTFVPNSPIIVDGFNNVIVDNEDTTNTSISTSNNSINNNNNNINNSTLSSNNKNNVISESSNSSTSDNSSDGSPSVNTFEYLFHPFYSYLLFLL